VDLYVSTKDHPQLQKLCNISSQGVCSKPADFRLNIIQIELCDRFDLRWKRRMLNPYNPGNNVNVNDTSANLGFAEDHEHPTGIEV
jgi:hypothetical protein